MSRAKLTIERELARAITLVSTQKKKGKLRLLVALSGGKDSVALLHALAKLRMRLAFDLCAAHFDHGLRKESAKDKIFACKLCQSLKIKFVSERASEQPKAESKEAWARRLRYDFLRRSKNKLKADWILTAHHANDQAETILMRLFEGRVLRAIQEQDSRRHLLRPLLQITRATIDKYVSDNNLKFRDDATNADITLTRNLYRLRIIPELERLVARPLVQAIARHAKSLEDDGMAFEWIVASYIEKLKSRKFGSSAWLKMLRAYVNQLPTAIAWRLVEQILLSKVKFKIGEEAATRALQFLANQSQVSGKICELVGGYRIVQLKKGAISVALKT